MSLSLTGTLPTGGGLRIKLPIPLVSASVDTPLGSISVLGAGPDNAGVDISRPIAFSAIRVISGMDIFKSLERRLAVLTDNPPVSTISCIIACCACIKGLGGVTFDGSPNVDREATPLGAEDAFTLRAAIASAGSVFASAVILLFRKILNKLFVIAKGRPPSSTLAITSIASWSTPGVSNVEKLDGKLTAVSPAGAVIFATPPGAMPEGFIVGPIP